MKLYVAVTSNSRSEFSPREMLTKLPDEVELYHTTLVPISDHSLLRLIAHGLLWENNWTQEDTRSEWWVES